MNTQQWENKGVDGFHRCLITLVSLGWPCMPVTKRYVVSVRYKWPNTQDDRVQLGEAYGNEMWSSWPSQPTAAISGSSTSPIFFNHFLPSILISSIGVSTLRQHLRWTQLPPVTILWDEAIIVWSVCLPKRNVLRLWSPVWLAVTKYPNKNSWREKRINLTVSLSV